MHTEVVENITGEDVVPRDAVLVILPGARDKVFSSRVGYVDLADRVVEPEGERREERDGVALVGHVGEAELQEGKSVTFRLLLEEKSEWLALASMKSAHSWLPPRGTPNPVTDTCTDGGTAFLIISPVMGASAPPVSSSYE
jgi:hypothetical protein